MIRRRLTLTATPDKRACASAIRGPWPRLAPDPPIDPGSRSLRSLGRDDNLSEAALVWGAARPGLVLSWMVEWGGRATKPLPRSGRHPEPAPRGRTAAARLAGCHRHDGSPSTCHRRAPPRPPP